MWALQALRLRRCCSTPLLSHHLHRSGPARLRAFKAGICLRGWRYRLSPAAGSFSCGKAGGIFAARRKSFVERRLCCQAGEQAGGSDPRVSIAHLGDPSPHPLSASGGRWLRPVLGHCNGTDWAGTWCSSGWPVQTGESTACGRAGLIKLVCAWLPTSPEWRTKVPATGWAFRHVGSSASGGSTPLEVCRRGKSQPRSPARPRTVHFKELLPPLVIHLPVISRYLQGLYI